MKNKPGEFVFIDDDGKEWVEYEYFKSIDKIAIENKLIVEYIQQLLGVYTTTDALVKIIELQQVAAQPSEKRAAEESGEEITAEDEAPFFQEEH